MDRRASLCQQCRSKLKPARLGTGKDPDGWAVGIRGYVVRRRNGRMEYRSRVVMSESLGRPLTSDEHVHHKNGDKTDDRLENLEIMHPIEHRRHHMEAGHAKYMSVLGHIIRYRKY